jgi:predicted ribosomally synthesized peptide with SipW-like signal peptide
MKKSLLLSVVSVAGAAALVGGMTLASFNDTEASEFPSLVAAGTIELDQQGVTSPLWVTNMKPGDVAEFTINLQNEGSLNGDLFARIARVTGIEDGCDVRDGWIDPERVESVVDNNCGDLTSGGDLAKYLSYEVVLPDGTVVPLPVVAEIPLGALASHLSADYILRVKFNDTGLDPDRWSIAQQNDAQGDGATIQLQFSLVQS